MELPLRANFGWKYLEYPTKRGCLLGTQYWKKLPFLSFFLPSFLPSSLPPSLPPSFLSINQLYTLAQF